jgi:hypothetical protein
MADGELDFRCDGDRWLLLVHQLPGKFNDRVETWRRLRALGVVTLNNSVYALPANAQTRGSFDWLIKDIAQTGGEAMIWEAEVVKGLSDREIRSLFNAARDLDYDGLAKEARALADTLGPPIAESIRAVAEDQLAYLKARAQKIVSIDFLGANGRETVDGLLGMLDHLLLREETSISRKQQRSSDPAELRSLKGRVWATRQDVHVDRIASAWLIRRFIDPDARFKFVPGTSPANESEELRFDMFAADYTHAGDRCTFEVLLSRTGLVDPALLDIGEIVHDIDLRDGKFGRKEAIGVAHSIAGRSMINKTDAERLDLGFGILDELHERLTRKTQPRFPPDVQTAEQIGSVIRV